MAGKKSEQQIGGSRRKRGAGLRQDSHINSKLAGGGNLVGLAPEPGGAIEFQNFKCLAARTPWSRARVAKELNAWCNRYNLISTQAQLPAFNGLVAAVMQADYWQRKLDGCADDRRRAEAGEEVIKAWRAAAIAVGKLDLKNAAGGGRDPVDDLLAEIEYS